MINVKSINKNSYLETNNSSPSFGAYELPKRLVTEIDRFSYRQHLVEKIEQTKHSLELLSNTPGKPKNSIQRALERITDENGIHIHFDEFKLAKDSDPVLNALVKCLGESDETGVNVAFKFDDLKNFSSLKERLSQILRKYAKSLVPQRYRKLCSSPIEVIAERTCDLQTAAKTTALMIRTKDNQIIPFVRPGEFHNFAQSNIDETVRNMLNNAGLE